MAATSYTLDEATQGRIAVRLKLGNTIEWCAEAAARTSGVPPSTAKYDLPGRFVAQLTPAPLVCLPIGP